MNWKVTECYLVALIGIIVLACWETKSDSMFWLHVAGIIGLIVFILLMPLLTYWYVRIFENAKKNEHLWECLKEHFRAEEMKKIYQKAEKTQCEHECEEIKKKQ